MPSLPGADHDRRAVGVVGADVDAAVPAELLEADPDVGLEVLDQVADVDVAVGVGQGAGDQNPSCAHAVLFPVGRDPADEMPLERGIVAN